MKSVNFCEVHHIIGNHLLQCGGPSACHYQGGRTQLHEHNYTNTCTKLCLPFFLKRYLTFLLRYWDESVIYGIVSFCFSGWNRGVSSWVVTWGWEVCIIDKLSNICSPSLMFHQNKARKTLCLLDTVLEDGLIGLLQIILGNLYASRQTYMHHDMLLSGGF